MNMKLVVMSLFILLFGLNVMDASGQTEVKKKGGTYGGLGFFKPGINTIQFTKLNGFLPTGYPTITNQPFVGSGAGYGLFNNFVIGGEGGNIHAGTFTLGNQKVELSGDYGLFSLGYVVVNKKGLLIFPLLGIGSNTLNVFIHQKDETATFQAITGEPFQSATLHHKTSLVKLSVSGIYNVMGNKSDKGSGGMFIGLEAGYQVAYKSGDWNYENGAITGGPDFSTNGFFIQLMIGGGGVARK
jgi:hypothetical protein